MVARFVITDEMWKKLKPLIDAQKRAGRPGKDDRLFIEAACWIMRTGAPWRDLPEGFGNWKTVYNRYSNWVKSRKFDQVFDLLKKRWRSRMAYD